MLDSFQKWWFGNCIVFVNNHRIMYLNFKMVLGMNVSDIKSKWKTNNKQNLASLWLGLLKFFTVDFDYSEYIVSIDSSTLVPRKTRKLFIVGKPVWFSVLCPLSVVHF